MVCRRSLLIELREKNDLKQEEVAEIIGTTQQNISFIETGKRNPSLILAKKLENLFDEPMENLFPDIFLNNNTTDCNLEGDNGNNKPA